MNRITLAPLKHGCLGTQNKSTEFVLKRPTYQMAKLLINNYSELSP